jgi:ribonuclease R
VRVQVSRVDLDGRKIDFRLVKEGEELLLNRAMKDKGVAVETREGAKAKKKGVAKKPAKSATKSAVKKHAPKAKHRRH